MRPILFLFACCVLAAAAPKTHVVSFGKMTSVKWYVGAAEDHAVELKIRPLYVDGRLKEYTLGPAHEITERLFVVQRALKVNDSLPLERNPQWRWQRGAWMLVDRVSGKISVAGLPEFDPYYSSASWYRDYAAYCGVSDDGKKLFAMVMQLGRRKPLLKKAMGDPASGEMPDSECSAPAWERPARVTFAAKDQKFSYSVRARTLDVIADDDDSE
jgi:hypothetical protein